MNSNTNSNDAASNPGHRSAAEVAQRAFDSVTGAFGNILSVPSNAFGQGAPPAGNPADRHYQIIEEEMRQKQLIASQKQMQLNALIKEREQQQRRNRRDQQYQQY